jgi:hypothetical protein
MNMSLKQEQHNDTGRRKRLDENNVDNTSIQERGKTQMILLEGSAKDDS